MLKAVKPTFKQVAWNNNACLHAKIDEGSQLSNAWHYHPEIELILIEGSAGTRIIGTSVETFGHNDLVLIGKNLPHAFLHDEALQDDQNRHAKALVIQFSENFLGNDFLSLPDTKDLQLLLLKARRGLCVSENGKEVLIPMIKKIFAASALERVILLLEILKTFIAPGACRTLVAEETIQSTGTNNRINTILEYSYENFDEHIKIEEIAKLVNLTKESFCRYFKTHTGKTYMEFLTEYRIKKACVMIRENQKSIKEIGYSCGFDSLSNFYYQFKKIVKLSPLDYKGQEF